MFRTLLISLFLINFSMSSAIAQTTGALDYDTTLNEYKFYNGTHWRRFNTGLGLTACSKPAQMEYNSALSYYRYCNGTTWIPIVGIITLSGCSGAGKMEFVSWSYYFCNGLVWVNMGGSII